MRRIISMSRRITCREKELRAAGPGGREEEEAVGKRRERKGCRRHAMTQTGRRLSEPPFIPCQVDLHRTPTREMHTQLHTHRAYARSAYAPLVPGIVITGSARDHSCRRRKSLRIIVPRSFVTEYLPSVSVRQPLSPLNPANDAVSASSDSHA